MPDDGIFLIKDVQRAGQKVNLLLGRAAGYPYKALSTAESTLTSEFMPAANYPQKTGRLSELPMKITASLLSLGFLLCVVSTAGASRLNAQEYHHFTFNVGGGFTGITGDQEGRLDHGGNFEAGAGFNFNQYVGILGTFTFNQLGITRSALDAAEQPDGNGRVYTFTVDPVLRFPIFGGVRGYVTGGGGWMRRTVQFTQPTLAQVTIFDPWWGYFGPALVPVNQVLGSFSSDAGAVDVGAGIDIPLPRTSANLYVQVKYMHGFTTQKDTAIVPVSVGLRW